MKTLNIIILIGLFLGGCKKPIQNQVNPPAGFEILFTNAKSTETVTISYSDSGKTKLVHFGNSLILNGPTTSPANWIQSNQLADLTSTNSPVGLKNHLFNVNFYESGVFEATYPMRLSLSEKLAPLSPIDTGFIVNNPILIDTAQIYAEYPDFKGQAALNQSLYINKRSILKCLKPTP